MKRIAMIFAFASYACVSPTVLKDPKTDPVAQCNASTPGIFPIIAQHEIDDCSATYARMGWQKQ